jgi:hypothetical protein
MLNRDAVSKVVRVLRDAAHYANTQPLDARQVLALVRERMADAIGGNNPNFNRERFVDSCMDDGVYR